MSHAHQVAPLKRVTNVLFVDIVFLKSHFLVNLYKTILVINFLFCNIVSGDTIHSGAAFSSSKACKI